MKKFILIAGLLVVLGCGKLEVDHQVSGSVSLNVTVTPETFEAFFVVDCAIRTTGQPCYDPDVSVCAACMAQALYATLPHS